MCVPMGQAGKELWRPKLQFGQSLFCRFSFATFSMLKEARAVGLKMLRGASPVSWLNEGNA